MTMSQQKAINFKLQFKAKLTKFQVEELKLNKVKNNQ